MVLKSEDLVFSRNEEGNLIPQEVILELLEDKDASIIAKPLTRGRLGEVIQKSKSEDLAVQEEAGNLILEHGLIEPALNKDQIKDIKPNMLNAITIAILSISSGLSQNKIQEEGNKIIEQKESDLKKNLVS